MQKALIPIFASLLTGVISSALVAWYCMEKPHLSIEYLGSVNVVDVNEDTKKLDIRYNGKSIGHGDGVLKIITVRIANDGNAPIRETDFTSKAPLGLTIVEGEIVETPQIIQASNPYLKEHIEPTQIGAHGVVFMPVLLNAGDYVTMKLLILDHGNSNAITDIDVAGGPLAGVDKPSIRRLYQVKEATSFWPQVFSGGPLVHITRIVMYSVGLAATIIVLLAVTYISLRTCEKIIILVVVRPARRRVTRSFQKLTKVVSGPEDDFIFWWYVMAGKGRLLQANEGWLRLPWKFQELVRVENPIRQAAARFLRQENFEYVVDERMLNMLAEFAAFLQQQKSRWWDDAV